MIKAPEQAFVGATLENFVHTAPDQATCDYTGIVINNLPAETDRAYMDDQGNVKPVPLQQLYLLDEVYSEYVICEEYVNFPSRYTDFRGLPRNYNRTFHSTSKYLVVGFYFYDTVLPSHLESMEMRLFVSDCQGSTLSAPMFSKEVLLLSMAGEEIYNPNLCGMSLSQTISLNYFFGKYSTLTDRVSNTRSFLQYTSNTFCKLFHLGRSKSAMEMVWYVLHKPTKCGILEAYPQIHSH